MEADLEDIRADKAAASEALARKRAGIPELEHDALPSTIANKLMRLPYNLGTCLCPQSNSTWFMKIHLSIPEAALNHQLPTEELLIEATEEIAGWLGQVQ